MQKKTKYVRTWGIWMPETTVLPNMQTTDLPTPGVIIQAH